MAYAVKRIRALPDYADTATGGLRSNESDDLDMLTIADLQNEGVREAAVQKRVRKDFFIIILQ